jgi:hypothetical protein
MLRVSVLDIPKMQRQPLKFKALSYTEHNHHANSLDTPSKFSLILKASDVNLTFK